MADTSKNINCDGIPINYDWGIHEEVATTKNGVYNLHSKTLKTNTDPSDFIKAYKKWGKEAVVWHPINGAGDHSSDNWKSTGTGSRCSMDNIYIVVIGSDGKPEYRVPNFKMIRVSTTGIREPKKRFSAKHKSIFTDLGVFIKPLKEGQEAPEDYNRRLDFLTCMKMFYDSLEQHHKDYKSAIKESYEDFYKNHKKSLKKSLKNLSAKDAAKNFIKQISYHLEFKHKVSLCTEVDPDDKDSRIPVANSMNFSVNFNMKPSETLVWPDTCGFADDIEKKAINVILDQLVSTQLLNDSDEKDNTKRLKAATLDNVTEETIHTFELFKFGSQVTGIVNCGLLAFSNLGLSCKPKFKKGTGGRNWVFIDPTTAFAGSGQDDDADDMLELAGIGNNKTEEDTSADAALAILAAD